MMEEQETSDEHATASEPSHQLVVGLGASAGGLEALEEFFDHVPAETGIAYVVVTHLAPGRVSLLPDLLGRHAKLPILQVNEPTPVRPDHIYLASPGINLGILSGVLHPMEIVERAPKSLPI